MRAGVRACTGLRVFFPAQKFPRMRNQTPVDARPTAKMTAEIPIGNFYVTTPQPYAKYVEALPPRLLPDWFVRSKQPAPPGYVRAEDAEPVNKALICALPRLRSRPRPHPPPAPALPLEERATAPRRLPLTAARLPPAASRAQPGRRRCRGTAAGWCRRTRAPRGAA